MAVIIAVIIANTLTLVTVSKGPYHCKIFVSVVKRDSTNMNNLL